VGGAVVSTIRTPHVYLVLHDNGDGGLGADPFVTLADAVAYAIELGWGEPFIVRVVDVRAHVTEDKPNDPLQDLLKGL
jgi:hypothetical protein